MTAAFAAGYSSKHHSHSHIRSKLYHGSSGRLLTRLEALSDPNWAAREQRTIAGAGGDRMQQVSVAGNS
ncbi:unnamed protein product [Acanthoscelides obtectus]|uniref:Uncharacterized protein n=1 Tax=Acanthoscelides obtectus TaxID=200917 RepID=A0A9P0L4E6_ACAOB|nr:unnamed protein product [Acanthoscelides obtectus]CAK1645315.1 hypothetical protein AOBTE_LOCUS14080 [Acanthoscelides obtectus]